MGLVFSKAKLLGQPYRSGYEGEGTDGGWGGWGGGDGAAGSGGSFAGSGAVSDLAELNASGGTITGGNLAGPAPGFGFAPGPVTTADALGWAGAVGEGSPVDAMIAPIVPVIEKATSVNVGQLVTNVLDAILGIAAAATGTIPGLASGLKTGMAVSAAPSAFTTSVTENYYAGAINAGLGAAAPSLFSGDAGGAQFAAATFAGAGASESGMGDQAGAVTGAPVIGFDGGFLNGPALTGAGSVTGSVAAASVAAAAALRGRYAAPVGQAAAPAGVPAAVALAGLASLLFMG